MAGRGAWNTAGVGGTKKYKDADRPGPYYYLGTGKKPMGRNRDDNEYAVYRAVQAYQRALSRALKTDLVVDGWLGEQTAEALTKFQEKHPECGTPWGGVGPDTSRALLLPTAKSVHKKHPKVGLNILTGTVKQESLWDAGAVGFTDDDDLGLAQINGRSHPDLSKRERTLPSVAFNFIADYHENALHELNGVVSDAVAAYNLGIGGARKWIKAGRPEIWSPTSTSAPRNVAAYIENILAG